MEERYWPSSLTGYVGEVSGGAVGEIDFEGKVKGEGLKQMI